jgi:hypothetical protein
MIELAGWADVIAEASFLLGELVGTDLIPEEFADQASRLSSDLADIASELRRD